MRRSLEIAMYSNTYRLTPREIEVLQLVSEGRSAKQIALQLIISPSTVERHVENVRLKTGARNRAHMTSIFMHDEKLGKLA